MKTLKPRTARRHRRRTLTLAPRPRSASTCLRGTESRSFGPWTTDTCPLGSWRTVSPTERTRMSLLGSLCTRVLLSCWCISPRSSRHKSWSLKRAERDRESTLGNSAFRCALGNSLCIIPSQPMCMKTRYARRE